MELRAIQLMLAGKRESLKLSDFILQFTQSRSNQSSEEQDWRKSKEVWLSILGMKKQGLDPSR